MAAQFARSDNWTSKLPTRNRSDTQVPRTCRLCAGEQEGTEEEEEEEGEEGEGGRVAWARHST